MKHFKNFLRISTPFWALILVIGHFITLYKIHFKSYMVTNNDIYKFLASGIFIILIMLDNYLDNKK